MPPYSSLIGEVKLVDVDRVRILILVPIVLPVDGHAPPISASRPVRASDVESVSSAVQCNGLKDQLIVVVAGHLQD